MANRSSWLVRIIVPSLVVLGVLGYVLHRRTGAAEPPEKSDKAESKNGKDKKGGDKSGPRAVPIVTAKVEQKDVPVWLEGLGSVTAWQQVTVHTQVDGRLDQVFFKEGQVVKRGDVLAQVDPRPYEVQLKQAQGSLLKDRATLKDTTLNLERNKTLLKDNLVAQQVVDDQQSLVGQSEGAVEIDQAAIDSAKLNLDYARIRSPLDGVVGVRLIDAGNIVHAADATGLVVITQLDPVAVFVTLPQDDLAKVVAAQRRGEVRVDVFGRDGKALLSTGKVAALDNQINATTSTLRVKAQLPNLDHKLWPNEFVKARVLVDTMKGVLVVPAAAVQRGPNGTFVYVVPDGKTAELRNVDVATITGDTAVVSGRIQAGELVVTEGQGQLRPGAPVVMRKPEAGEDKSKASDQHPDGTGIPTPKVAAPAR